MLSLTRSESLTNLPINAREPRTGLPEDIRLTWMKKAKKIASLTGSHVCEFNNLLLLPKNEQPCGTSICAEPIVIESEPFLLCGNTWTVKLYPYGVDEDSEFVSIKLQNKTEEVVNAYYALAIKRSDALEDEQRLNMWVDPDVDSLYFQPNGHEDSSWGVDDFIPLDELYSTELGYLDIFGKYDDDFAAPEELLEEKLEESSSMTSTQEKEQGEGKEDGKENTEAKHSVDIQCDVFIFRNARGERVFDRLYIEVQMMVYGEVSLKAHPLTQAIEQKNASNEDLIVLADKDLDLIRQATKGGGPSLAELSALQDNILSTLCPSPPEKEGRKPVSANFDKGGLQKNTSRPVSSGENDKRSSGDRHSEAKSEIRNDMPSDDDIKDKDVHVSATITHHK